MNDIVYRVATLEDAEPIAALFRHTRQTCLPYLPVLHSADDDVEFFSSHVLPEDSVWVAEQASRIVGFCAFGHGWLNHLYVHPSHHGFGIGGELLRIAMQTNGALDLWVFQQNSQAIRFYESHGFSLVEKTDGSKNEEHVPDALYCSKAT